MSVAINAIRRLEGKIEDLTAALTSANAKAPSPTPISTAYAQSPLAVTVASPANRTTILSPDTPRQLLAGAVDEVLTPTTLASAMKHGTPLSFSQHRVAIWPAIQQILPPQFVTARAGLSQDYIVDIETNRAELPIDIHRQYGTYAESWLMSLPQSAVKGLADAYFAVFHRNTPILDKYFFHSNTLGGALATEFGYDIESCLVLVVLALGSLAVKAHEEGNFALPSRQGAPGEGFIRPEWYELILEEPAGLSFFNEARKRFGFLMCQTDLQAGQFYSLSTLYYAQVLRPLDSWTTVGRATQCCMSILSRSVSPDFDTWEGDMFSRLFWNTLMYETVIAQELDLRQSGILDYEAEVPLPRFTPSPHHQRSLSISGLISDEDDSFFNFHFLAQAAHRIILTRVKQSLYHFAERQNYPSASITAEMHHQLEQWRANLPPSLQFSDDENADDSPSPAHVIAKAMLRSRYLVCTFHIGRPFLYKALHAPDYTTEAEYAEVRNGLRGGMFWPTTMGLCTQMLSALPIKFGWVCQCFGQVLLFHAVARSPDEHLRQTLPDGWEEWVRTMLTLIESCGQLSPAIAKDAELLRLL